MSSTRHALDNSTAKAVAEALGEELRQAREAKGWSRARFVDLLPSGIGERTVLAYEHGLRTLTVLRLMELCDVLDVTASTLLSRALQKAHAHLTNLDLRVDLRTLINDGSVTYRPMIQWAKNKLSNCPDGIAEVPPAAVAELANLMGHKHQDLAAYLARFTPETTPSSADDSVPAIYEAGT